MRSASTPSITFEAMIISLARPRPTTDGSRDEPPTSGIRPTRVSTRPMTPSAAMTRRSAASASSIAPPMQAPWIWAIVGLGISSSRFHVSMIGRREARSRPGSPARRAEEVDVHPAGEHRARAAQDHAVDAVVVGRGVQRVTQPEHQLVVERVALLGAVEDDVADRAAVLGLDDWHGRDCTRRFISARVQLGSCAMAEIKKVGIVGCGLMGHGIAQVVATAGYDVVVREVDDATLQKGLGKIEKQLARAVEKGKSTQEDADAIRARLKGTTDYADFADADLIIEAITENLGLKLEMWKELDAIVKPGAIFATNTSSLAVIDQAASTVAPDALRGPALLQPRAGHEARRGRARRDDDR